MTCDQVRNELTHSEVCNCQSRRSIREGISGFMRLRVLLRNVRCVTRNGRSLVRLTGCQVIVPTPSFKIP
jgi:hypothetical protein